MNIPVVYEDEWLLVADKPSGLLVVPTPKKESRTLTSILNQDLKEKGGSFFLWPCHRLDRETSGLVIYAKGRSMEKKVSGLFRQRQVRKTYIAFVSGSPFKPGGRISSSIEGAPAVTDYKVIEKRKDFAIVEVHPLTGRTNQIRIHFKRLGHPLLGERVYAFRRDFKIKAKRLCLHAGRLEFRHPATLKGLDLFCGLPKDLQEFLERNK